MLDIDFEQQAAVSSTWTVTVVQLHQRSAVKCALRMADQPLNNLNAPHCDIKSQALWAITLE